jgi:flavodoxin I
MKKIGLFYSFESNKSALVAKKISEHLKDNVKAIDALTVDEKKFLEYDNMILGVPTWFDGELPGYWDEFVPAIEDLNLKGKKVAIYGNGDQKGYPENFIDAVGIMADILENQGARIVGFTPTKGYEFESSRALRGKQFCGLAIDFENQPKSVNEKIEAWVEQLKKEFD